MQLLLVDNGSKNFPIICLINGHHLGNLGIIAILKTDRQTMQHTPEIEADAINETDEIEIISKTQIKKAMLDLQALGEALVDISRSGLLTLNLPEKLFDAIIEAKRLTNFGAIKRQHQYIGKLMRHVDPEPIQAYLDKIQGVSQAHKAWIHRLEKLRDALIADDQALQNILDDYPDVNIQQLRTQIRNARKEREANKPPKHYRALFQTLKELLPEPAAAHHDI